DADMLMRKSWATPRYAADKGLLLRDTEPDIAADGAAFASCLNGRGREPLRRSCEKASRRFSAARRRRAVTMKGLATGQPSQTVRTSACADATITASVTTRWCGCMNRTART